MKFDGTDAETVTVALPLAFIVAALQESSCPDEIEQLSQPVDDPTLQERVFNSWSLSATLYAFPAPVLLTTIVKVAVPPATMVPLSGVLVMVRFGHWSVTDAVSLTLLTPVAAPVAMFLNPPATQPWFALVVALMTAVIDEPAARSSGPQLSEPLEIAQFAPDGLELPSV
jgi:hypothetical protein